MLIFTEDDASCTPETHFEDDCNTCYCPPEGKRKNAQCTIVGCYHKPSSGRGIPEEFTRFVTTVKTQSFI